MPDHNQQRSSQVIRARSRQLRREMTPAEQILWQHVRGGKLGIKLRRQHPIGRFIADFCCVEHKLIIELDGSVHADQAERDAERTLLLEAADYRVLRFTNAQVLYETPAVLAQIVTALAASSDSAHGCKEE
jgi:very-short-patch-repair endonuclease